MFGLLEGDLFRVFGYSPANLEFIPLSRALGLFYGQTLNLWMSLYIYVLYNS